MSVSFIKEPCCENFCLKSGGTDQVPQYFSNLNLYVRPVINDISIINPDSTKYTWNNITNSYEPIWEWRGFMRTFQSNGNTLPVRLIQSSLQHQGLIWFLQVRNWINSSLSVIVQNDYGILAYYNTTNVNNYPIGTFTLNDGSIVSQYTPITTLPLSSLISEGKNDNLLSTGYCEFVLT
jgi:hypothetical protein